MHPDDAKSFELHTHGHRGRDQGDAGPLAEDVQGPVVRVLDADGVGLLTLRGRPRLPAFDPLIKVAADLIHKIPCHST